MMITVTVRWVRSDQIGQQRASKRRACSNACMWVQLQQQKKTPTSSCVIDNTECIKFFENYRGFQREKQDKSQNVVAKTSNW
jgi:hypothetical protein